MSNPNLPSSTAPNLSEIKEHQGNIFTTAPNMTALEMTEQFLDQEKKMRQNIEAVGIRADPFKVTQDDWSGHKTIHNPEGAKFEKSKEEKEESEPHYGQVTGDNFKVTEDEWDGHKTKHNPAGVYCEQTKLIPEVPIDNSNLHCGSGITGDPFKVTDDKWAGHVTKQTPEMLPESNPIMY